MKNHTWRTPCLALALTLALLWATPALAQGRGKGQGWGCWQGQGQGRGAGYNTCPNYPGYQSGQGQWSNNPQAGSGRRGTRGGGRAYQPNSQPTVPPTQ